MIIKAENMRTIPKANTNIGLSLNFILKRVLPYQATKRLEY